MTAAKKPILGIDRYHSTVILRNPLRPYSVQVPCILYTVQLKPTLGSRVDRHEGIPGPGCVSGRGKLGDPAFRLKCWLGVGFTATLRGSERSVPTWKLRELGSWALPAMRFESGEGNLGWARWKWPPVRVGTSLEAARKLPGTSRNSVSAAQRRPRPAVVPGRRLCLLQQTRGRTQEPQSWETAVLPRCYPLSINVH